MSEPQLDMAAFRGRLLTRELGRQLRYAESVGSTNDVVLAAAEEGAEQGFLVIADEQTSGRGRAGTSWVAPPGKALLFSVLLTPRMTPAEVPRLTLATAVAVCSTLREGGLEDAQIKWPNDVLLQREKIAGILCESRSRGDRVDAVVIGVGLNVGQVESELPKGATSIRAVTGQRIDRAELLAEILNRLEDVVARVISGRFEEVREQWQALAPLHMGHGLRIKTEEGSLSGTGDGIDGDGALRLRLSDGEMVRVVSGSLTFE